MYTVEEKQCIKIEMIYISNVARSGQLLKSNKTPKEMPTTIFSKKDFFAFVLLSLKT